MHAEPVTMPHAAPRPAFPQSSRTLEHADQRTRQLAEAMVRLNGESMGGATEEALLREGFSRAELRHHTPAATQLANARFVRQVAEAAGMAPLKSDEELLAIALDRAGGLIDPGQIVAVLRSADFTHETLARLWPRLMQRLAHKVARLPVPEVA